MTSTSNFHYLFDISVTYVVTLVKSSEMISKILKLFNDKTNDTDRF
jgi:hypothetical protein